MRDLPQPPKPGRNDPCTCGSGKKSKKCCADPVKIQAEEERVREAYWAKLDAEEAEARAKGQPSPRALRDRAAHKRALDTIAAAGMLGYFGR